MQIGKMWVMEFFDISFSGSNNTQVINLTGTETNKDDSLFQKLGNNILVKKAGTYILSLYLNTTTVSAANFHTWIKVQYSLNNTDWLDLVIQHHYTLVNFNEYVSLCSPIELGSNRHIRFMGTTSVKTQCHGLMRIVHLN